MTLVYSLTGQIKTSWSSSAIQNQVQDLYNIWPNKKWPIGKIILLTVQAVLHLYLKSDGKLSKVCISLGFTESANPLAWKFESENASPLLVFFLAYQTWNETNSLYPHPCPFGQLAASYSPKKIKFDSNVGFCYFSYQMDSANVRSFLILTEGMRSGGDSHKAAND